MTEETSQDTLPTTDPALEDAPSGSASSTPEATSTPESEAGVAPESEAGVAPEATSTPESEAGVAPEATSTPESDGAVQADVSKALAGEVSEDLAAEEPVAAEEGKKRRRRKRKKKGADDSAENKSAVEHKEGVLARFLGAHARRRHVVHAFSVGEVVAGRVERVEDGAIVLDLFGKGMASVDVLEPREVPVLPDPPPEAPSSEAPSSEAPSSEAASPEAASPEAPSSEAPSSEAPSSEAPSSEAPSSEAASPEPAAQEVGPSVEVMAAVESAEVAAARVDGPSEDGVTRGAEGEPQADAPDEQAVAEATPPEPPPDPPALGSVFRGRIAGVAESGHMALVNRIIDRPVAKAAVAAARDEHRRVDGLVYGFNRGGFDVIIEGIRVFCPASGMSLTPIDDPTSFLGKKVEFSVPTGKTGRSIVVSRRSILEREARKQARARMAALKPGQRMRGHVSQVREFGLLVDVGEGLEGLVHMSEVAWARGTRPADVAKPGDEVEVEVLKVQLGNRKDRYGKLSLSMKACLPDPWDEQADLLCIGAARKGKVTSTTDFGAFVELAPGLEGLLHISELGGQDIKHANQVVREGEELDVVIERLDKGQRRVSLSRLSAADAEAIARGDIDPEKAPRSLKQGAHVMVVVQRADRRGVKVQVQGVLGKRGRGFISSRDLGDATGDGRQPMGVGTVLEVKVTGTDRDGSLRCSVRGKEQDEERQAVRAYRKEAAQQGFGTFGDLLRAKLGGGDEA